MDTFHSIQIEWLKQAKRHGRSIALIDSSGAVFSSFKLLATVMYFSKKLSKKLLHQQNIGIILPASAAGVIANLQSLCLGKTVVNLNYASGDTAIKSAIKQAELKTIITSRFFVDKLKSRGIDLDKTLAETTLIYLEDFKSNAMKISIAHNLLLVRLFPSILLKWLYFKDSPLKSNAAILFSSGSEGSPKGVELTHKNILSNIKQIFSIFGIVETDTMLCSLPLFHAFGLTATTLMPLIQGVPIVCYADPTNSLAIAKLIYRYDITLLCTTSTFLGMYNRNQKIHPLMLSPLRLVVAGAEKLSPIVYDEFKKKFNLDVYEGYGATELAPVASCNLPDVLSVEDWHVHQANKPGTVGLPLPGCAFRIVDPNTCENLPIGEEGMVLIGGTQVMQGYLKDIERTKNVLIEEDDFIWYKTGDKGRLDEEGYLTIVDRYSRFAKIGGEMVGLGEIEEQVKKILADPTIEIMAVAVTDPKKGERIVLLCNHDEVSKKIIDALIKAHVPKLMIPSDVIYFEELPKLATGKKDYVTAKQLVTGLSAASK